jgi:hypothetical protein
MWADGFKKRVGKGIFRRVSLAHGAYGRALSDRGIARRGKGMDEQHSLERLVEAQGLAST